MEMTVMIKVMRDLAPADGGYALEVGVEGDASVHHQHLVVDDGGQGQPAVHLLQKP